MNCHALENTEWWRQRVFLGANMISFLVPLKKLPHRPKSQSKHDGIKAPFASSHCRPQTHSECEENLAEMSLCQLSFRAEGLP